MRAASRPITDSIDDRLHHLAARQLVQWAAEEFAEGLVMSTSFGIQSAVTLHLVTRVRPEIPVIWVDTGYLPKETYRYANQLTKRLDLNLHVARSVLRPDAMEFLYGRLWESERQEDLDLYDRIRKVEPMQQALESLGATAWIAGVRSEQTEYRQKLTRVKRKGSRYRIYPILQWSKRDVYEYMQRHNLPQHPLFAQGYATVGDAHSSRPLRAGETERATRFRGRKQECGLHTG